MEHVLAEARATGNVGRRWLARGSRQMWAAACCAEWVIICDDSIPAGARGQRGAEPPALPGSYPGRDKRQYRSIQKQRAAQPRDERSWPYGRQPDRALPAFLRRAGGQGRPDRRPFPGALRGRSDLQPRSRSGLADADALCRLSRAGAGRVGPPAAPACADRALDRSASATMEASIRGHGARHAGRAHRPRYPPPAGIHGGVRAPSRRELPRRLPHPGLRA